MNTNLDYQKAHEAISLVKSGTDLNEAITETKAKLQLVNIMIGNEEVITEDTFVDEETRSNRNNICNSCDQNQFNTCSVCACPLPVLINMKFKSCPINKW